MILKLHDNDDGLVLVNIEHVSIIEAISSMSASYAHTERSRIRTTDGYAVKVKESVEQIAAMIAAAHEHA